MFKGSITALVTPFKNNKLDEDSYEKFIEFQISNGTNGIVPGGTTGESPTLEYFEHKKIIEIAVKVSNGRIPVIAGTGSNSTKEAIELTKFAENAKADAALIVTPYYNKPTQEGLYQHYKAINDNCGIPIIIYNIPGRSVVDMSVDTMARLFELKNIVGVKDATGDLDRATAQKNKMGDEFIMLTGNDENAYEFNKRGGVGCISVSSNVAPKMCSEFQKFSNNGNDIEAKKLFDQLLELHHVMFVESNPVPAKYSLSLLKLMEEDVRLPLVTATEDSKNKIRNILKKTSII
ncbi:MAG: 4-hydroxy-tetrahydrodipicolinate synthase [Proteobacteria bacterium]|jgi:4-hydroxy-tetrahydrodipicolinate synthase|nr:4-hydroxy-tetrahydrodipicolinate synthase [Pseudomonadota bacterium]NCV24513.1 4-hydroxy-tetrahydrodipicolinate synthase [Pseudomonadota bacterium]NCW80110.1 4-hydroxy-tetrahydrodipicolinate synthase [Pelagibacteraceae bacterium]